MRYTAQESEDERKVLDAELSLREEEVMDLKTKSSKLIDKFMATSERESNAATRVSEAESLVDELKAMVSNLEAEAEDRDLAVNYMEDLCDKHCHEMEKRDAELSNITECAQIANGEVVRLTSKAEVLEKELEEASTGRSHAEKEVGKLSGSVGVLEAKLSNALEKVDNLTNSSLNAEKESVHLMSSLANTTQQISISHTQAEKDERDIKELKGRHSVA